MLRVAVPNKGALSGPAREMLQEAGYLTKAGPRELVVADPGNDAEFFFLRPKDIATYIGGGTLDVGITGKDMLLESGSPATPVLDLGFGAATFRLAAPTGGITSPEELNGMRVATSYPHLLEKWLVERGVQASIVRLDGAVENAVRLGVADAIADVVDTGNTLRAAGLRTIGEPLLASEAILVRSQRAADDPAVATFVRRLQSVIVARTYVLLDYDIPVAQVDAACDLTPGLESPTISPLRDPQWVAIRVMVPRSDVQNLMDELRELGARGILVTLIHACRL